MTKGLAAVIFPAVLCACSQQHKTVTVTFRYPSSGQVPDPQTDLEQSKKICESMGREFTLLEQPSHWRYSCEPHGVKPAVIKVK
jgi:hypothetical protein